MHGRPSAVALLFMHFQPIHAYISSASMSVLSSVEQGRSRKRPLRNIDLGDKALRVYSLSDLHTDNLANLKFTQSLPSTKTAGTHEALIVAGDISSSHGRVIETLKPLLDIFDSVHFVVGNHDVWVDKGEEDRKSARSAGASECSIQKMLDTMDLCEELGVCTGPVRFTMNSGGQRTIPEDVYVVPLISWYHASFDKEPDLPKELQHRNGEFSRRWGDFRRCKWPAEIIDHADFTNIGSSCTALAEYFAELNNPVLEDRPKWLEESMRRGAAVTTLSFSHFLPRQELCPEKRFLKEPNLPKVIGSDPLGRQVKELGSDIHIFGHTHIPIDIEIEGVRHVQWPLGNPPEQLRQCGSVKEKGPLLVWGTGASVQETVWGEYYSTNPRKAYPAPGEKILIPAWAMTPRPGREGFASSVSVIPTE